MHISRMFGLAAVVVFLAACQHKGAERPSSEILTEHKWVVEQIAGQPINANSRVTLLFSGDGRIAGRASCNRLSGHYSVESDSDTLQFSDLATTKMACPEPLMEQERRFVEALGSVQSYALSQHGALMLYRDQEVVVEAQPEEG